MDDAGGDACERSPCLVHRQQHSQHRRRRILGKAHYSLAAPLVNTLFGLLALVDLNFAHFSPLKPSWWSIMLSPFCLVPRCAS
jgi:hypothetical protein